jgi:hypothetical protein
VAGRWQTPSNVRQAKFKAAQRSGNGAFVDRQVA